MGFNNNFIQGSESCEVGTVVDAQFVSTTSQGSISFSGTVSTDCPAGMEVGYPTWAFQVINSADAASDYFGPYNAGTMPPFFTIVNGPHAGTTVFIDVSGGFLNPVLYVSSAFAGTIRIEATLAALDQCDNSATDTAQGILSWSGPMACMTITDLGAGEFSFSDCSGANACPGGITSWEWSGYGLDDNTPLWTSSLQNPPNYTYTVAGRYRVKLRVTTGCGSQTIEQYLNHYSGSLCLQVDTTDFDRLSWDVTDLELLGIPVEPRSGGLIDTIDTRPAGSLYNPGGTLEDTLTWDAVDSRYEPDNPPITLYEGTWRVEIPPMDVTLRDGRECSVGYVGTFYVGPPEDNPPQITATAIYVGGVPVSTILIGDEMEAVYTYYDANGDAEDTAATQGSIRWYGYADLPGTSGETLLSTSPTYTLTAGDIATYLSFRFKIIPYATSTTELVGAEVTSDVVQNTNSVPTITGQALTSSTGIFESGATLTLGYTYNDADGDAEDTAATVASVEWRTYTNATGTVGETTVSTGSLTYVIQPGDVGRYIEASITPHALTGNSPGPEATTARTIVVQLAYTGSTTKQVAFQITQTGGVGIVDWGDATTSNFNASAGSTNIMHTYAGPGTYNWKVYCSPTAVTAINISNQQLTGTLDISLLTALTSMNVGTNTSLTAITNPTSSAVWTSYICSSTGLTSLNLSTLSNLGGVFSCANSLSLSSLTVPTNSQPFTVFYAFFCALSGTVNLSTLSGLAGDFQINNNASMTGLTLPTSAGVFTRFYCFNTGVTSLNLSGLSNLGGDIRCNNNVSMASFTAPSSSQIITNFTVANSTALASLNVSSLTGLRGVFAASFCSITSFTFPTTSATFTSFTVHGNPMTTVDISMLTGLSGGVYFYQCANLTSITMPASSGSITFMYGYSCQLGVFDITGLTFAANINFQIQNNAMTAAEVNEMLVDMDATFPGTGTGSINTSGTNAAPDTTSGGFNGSAAKANLISEGYTVTTS